MATPFSPKLQSAVYSPAKARSGLNLPLAPGSYATRCDMPVNAIAGMLGGTARIRHKNRVGFRRIRAKFPLFTVRTDGVKVTEIDIAGNITIACAIEYPINSGVYYQFTFGGATSKTTTCAAENGVLVSDWLYLPIYIAPDASFQTRTFIQCAATGAFYGSVYTSSSYSEGTAYSATTPVDASASGTITNGFNFAYGPCDLQTDGTVPTIALSGSSSAYGTGDSASGDANGCLGASAQFAWRCGMGILKLAAPGERSGDASATTWKYRLRLAAEAGCQVVWFHSVSNDITTAGGITTLAGLIAAQQNCINLYKSVLPNARTVGSPIQPRTTTTDAWATDANQTAVGGFTPTGSGLREIWNDGLLNGSINLYDAVVSGTVEVTESPTRRGVWVNSTGGAGPGTANYATTDGIHKTAALHLLAAQRTPLDSFWKII